MSDHHPLSCRHETRLDRREARKADWPEDSLHENGNYQNLCVECGCTFIGHKRRVVCRACPHSHLCCCRDCMVGSIFSGACGPHSNNKETR